MFSREYTCHVIHAMPCYNKILAHDIAAAEWLIFIMEDHEAVVRTLLQLWLTMVYTLAC